MKELGNHIGDSFCNWEVGKAVLSHTQKQEAMRENEPSGEEEVVSKVKGEVTECKVIHAA